MWQAYRFSLAEKKNVHGETNLEEKVHVESEKVKLVISCLSLHFFLPLYAQVKKDFNRTKKERSHTEKDLKQIIPTYGQQSLYPLPVAKKRSQQR